MVPLHFSIHSIVVDDHRCHNNFVRIKPKFLITPKKTNINSHALVENQKVFDSWLLEQFVEFDQNWNIDGRVYFLWRWTTHFRYEK